MENFANFRRSYGRELSERLLVYASMVLSQSARAVDVLARVGQSDFALLLPETSSESLPAFLSRLRARIRLAKFELDERTIRPGLVIGTASFPEIVGAPEHLVRSAFLDLRQELHRGEVGSGSESLLSL
jgi:diguanylate cyclase (GGDEF)-like protein